MRLADGRQVVFTNLIVSIVSILFGFIGARHQFQREQHDGLNSPNYHLSRIAVSQGIQEVSLPPPYEHLPVLTVEPTGLIDTGFKMVRFFTQKVQSPVHEKLNVSFIDGFRSQSVILSSLLRSKSGGKAKKTSALFLCSAASCLLPFLTQYHSMHTGGDVSVSALVYGDAVIGSVVQRSLAHIGVLTQAYVTQETAIDVMPLHGALPKTIAGEHVGAYCSISSNTCQYIVGNDQNMSTAVRAPLIPLNEVEFLGSPLSQIENEVVHIDVSSDETLAAVTYLTGILRGASLPHHIFITVYPSALLWMLMEAIDILKRRSFYSVMSTGSKCVMYASSSTVSARVRLWDVSSYSTRVNARSYAAEPLCELLLSRHIRSPSHLFDCVAPIEPDLALVSFLGPGGHANRRQMVIKNENERWYASRMLLFVVVPLFLLTLLVFGIIRKRRV
ncbi:hypothetical protein ERJ75_000963700 [Trypanosoma vivax]|uniref:Uncharacterized protein n=1 Tax=Trypanosoma vivax (strain Y486) TaxID=1055687 RepID=G0U6J5_TRYVY|nr:hypothetical protein TRVL_10267 [Trypanosoma vivax]KAH8611823.1 hypothetical protein ERJ75_000963700 [Trypanosoma vivax]CCC51499.1 conserved hypothetical protein [Trypanosoma vivax Y486]